MLSKIFKPHYMRLTKKPIKSLQNNFAFSNNTQGD